jgi:hypothetical protein
MLALYNMFHHQVNHFTLALNFFYHDSPILANINNFLRGGRSHVSFIALMSVAFICKLKTRSIKTNFKLYLK